MDKDTLQSLTDKGLTIEQISTQTARSRSTIRKWLRRHGLKTRQTARKGSWSFAKADIECAVSSSKTIAEALSKLGLPTWGSSGYRTFRRYISEYGLDTSHFIAYNTTIARNANTIPLKDILSGKHPAYKTFSLKQRLYKENIKQRKCEECGIDEWRGRPAPLSLDHINGKPWDHRLENLRILCAMCHAQTDTFCGKNRSSIKPRRSRMEYRRDVNQRYVEAQLAIIPAVHAAGIDMSKKGWVTKMAPVIGQKPQKTREWIARWMPELLENAHTRRNAAV